MVEACVVLDLEFEACGLAVDGDVSDAGDFAVVHDALRPLFFGQVLDLVGVLFRVDFFEEFDTDDAVVGGFVLGDSFGTGFRVLAVDVVDALGVEDFVDARRLVSGLFACVGDRGDIRTMASHHWA